MSTAPKYFEDLAMGDEFETPSRTITESDLVAFATLTGDMNPLHTDAEFAKGTPYGARIAHGMLLLSYAIGLLDRSRIFSGTALANLGIKEFRFEKPVLIGDTIRVVVRIGAMRKTSDGLRGIVERELSILNQRNETVARGGSAVMLRLRS